MEVFLPGSTQITQQKFLYARLSTSTQNTVTIYVLKLTHSKKNKSSLTLVDSFLRLAIIFAVSLCYPKMGYGVIEKETQKTK